MQEAALAGKVNAHQFVATVPSLPRRFKGVNLSRVALPRGSLATSGQVRVLASSPAAKQAATEVPDRVLRTLETQNLSALETLSLSDSLLTGLGKMLFPRDSVGHDEVSIPELGSFDDEVSREALFFSQFPR